MNTKLFQVVASGRKSKNFVPKVRHGSEIITEQGRIMEVFSEAYDNLLDKAPARDHTLDLDYLDMSQLDLTELQEIFTENEIWQVIKELPPDRAPGPD